LNAPFLPRSSAIRLAVAGPMPLTVASATSSALLASTSA
jgi:hypothetical protein